MIGRHRVSRIAAVSLFCFFSFVSTVFAGTSAERVAVEAGVRAEVMKDLAVQSKPKVELFDRTCLDGRSVVDFQGDIVEFWANLECSYCGIREPLQAQRDNPDMCIVVRHIPTGEYSESLKKALSYEALKRFSINAANLFWDAVVPKTALGIPSPYEAALLLAFQEAAISPETFTETLTKDVSELVSRDIFAAQGRISSTPTYVLAGIRFPSCDFKAAELRQALELAKKAREGDQDAIERIIKIITDGLMNETTL